jgi:hypothetical protein
LTATLAGVEDRPLFSVYSNWIVPPPVPAGRWKVAVYVNVMELPHAVPVMLSGLTARSTLVTLKGGAVGAELEPVLL